MKLISKALQFLCVLLLIKGAHPQAQPCLVCGDAILRIWSLMSREGDHYLRITDDKADDDDTDDDDADDDDDDDGHFKVDFKGEINAHKLTSLLKIRDTPTLLETRVQFVFRMNNKDYHLYAPSVSSELLAMPASEGIKATDNRNTFAPERLRYEHRLFTVFQSVKFRGYYLSSDGDGKPSLQKVINKAYREPGQLFLTIDPGNAIRGIAFGSGNTVGRKKREILGRNLASYKQQRRRKFRWARPTRRCIKPRPSTTPKPVTTERPTTNKPVRDSSVMMKLDLPDDITFVLCFWIKTRAKMGQLVSLVEDLQIRNQGYGYNQRRFQRSYRKKERKTISKNILNVSIYNGRLRLEIGYKRTSRTLRNCMINDDKFHHICASLNDQYELEIYKDSVSIFKQCLKNVACDFVKKNTTSKRRGTFTLGNPRNKAPRSMNRKPFDGSLFQVNMWDQYPSFRIKRIATNCACGGGNLIKWTDLLNGTMTDVNVSDNSQCPKLEGYTYDELTQSRLI